MPAESEKAAKAAEIVRQYMLGSFATQMGPSLPLLDHTLQSEVRFRLVQALAKHYDVDFTGKRVRSLLDELVGLGSAGVAMKLLKGMLSPASKGENIYQEAKSFLGVSVSGGTKELASRMIKSMVPGARVVLDLGDIIESLGTLYAVGRVFIKHFEGGGTIGTFEVSLVKEEFEREMQMGRKIVELKAFEQGL
jgi:hypothetical protein